MEFSIADFDLYHFQKRFKNPILTPFIVCSKNVVTGNGILQRDREFINLAGMLPLEVEINRQNNG